MKIKLWQVICFILVIVGITIIIIPSKKKVIALHIEGHLLEQARQYISRYVSEDPDDVLLLMLSSKVYLLEGRSTQAINDLETSLKIDKDNEDILFQLATLYEYERNPKRAMRVLERLAEVAPWRKKAWRQLIDYYRYYMYPEKESAAIAQLLHLEKLHPEKNMPTDVLSALLSRDLNDLTQRLMNEKTDTYIDAVLSRLYLLRKQYWEKLHKSKERMHVFTKQTVTRCLELYVMTDQIERALAFASFLDEKQKSGLQKQLQLAKILRWSGMHDASVALIASLYQSHPKNKTLLLTMTKTGQEIGDIASTVFAFQELIRHYPDQESYKEDLASVYLSTGKPEKAYHLYKQLAELPQLKVDYLHQMITVAGYTGNNSLMAQALEIAEKRMPEDPFILQKRAEYFVAMNQPQKAYPLYWKLVYSSGQPKAGVKKVLEVAGYTSDKKIITDAIQHALVLYPDDKKIVQKTAEMYLWIDATEKAYDLYKKLALWSNGEKREIEKMLQVAGFTGNHTLTDDALNLAIRLRPSDPALRLKKAEVLLGKGEQNVAAEAYVDYLKLNPEDLKAQKQLAQIYLWNNTPHKAYQIYKKLYQKNPSDPFVQKKVLQLSKWTNQHEDTLSYLEKLAKEDSMNYDKALTIGNAFVEIGNLNKGIPYLERAHALRPEDVSLRKKLAAAYGWAGHTEKMVTQLEHLDNLGAISGKDHITLAQAYLNRQDGIKALKHLKAYEKESKITREEGILLATAYELIGHGDRAKKIYNRLYQNNRNDPQFLAKMGRQALWQNQTDVALQFFEGALKKNTKNLIALKGSAQIYAWNNDLIKAIQRFEAYNRIDPNDYEVRYQLGELYIITGRQGDAFKEYNKTLKLIKKVKISRPIRPSSG